MKDDVRKEVRSIEILFLLLSLAAVVAILCIYGDVLGIVDKVIETYGDIWEILFPR